MATDEILQFMIKRNRSQPQVTGFQVMPSPEAVAALYHSPVAGSVSDKPDLGLGILINHGRGHPLSGCFILACQAIHITDIIVRAFTVYGRLVVSAATSKKRSSGVTISRQSSIGDTVAIHITISGKFFHPV